MIKQLKQTKKTNCGQTCVAMLMDISIEEAEKLVGHDGITTQEELWKVLDTKYPRGYYNFFFGRIKYRNRDIVKQRLHLCQHRNPKDFEQAHWTICENGVIIDPSGRDEKDLWPMWKFWILHAKT